MKKIRVANASSFFQEKGMDMNGIFCLLCNAISRENFLSQQSSGPLDCPVGLFFCTPKDATFYAIGVLQQWAETFNGDLTLSGKRIKQYYEDYARLKNLNQEISKIGFWDYLFPRKEHSKKILAQRREIESMEVDVSELVEIAYYKYVEAKIGNREDFIREFSRLMEQALQD